MLSADVTSADVVALVLAGLAVLGAGWVVSSRLLGRPADDEPVARPDARFATPSTGRPGDDAGDAGAYPEADGTGVAEQSPRFRLRPPRAAPRPQVARDWPPKPPTLPQRERTDAVSVLLLVDRRDNTTRWRIASTTDARCTTVDVFSYRREQDDSHRGWHHELLDGPLHLEAHEHADLDGPPPTERYLVSVSWTVGFAGGSYRERRLLEVEPTSG